MSEEVISILDAFGLRIGRGDAVVYAGTDHKRRLTQNYGVIDDVEPHKVRVMRFERNGLGGAEEKFRRVWVDREKVARVPLLSDELRKQERLESADEFEDEFGPYLEDALKNTVFRAAWEGATAERGET